MNHQEIRFNILHSLYQKHYNDQLKHPQNTDKIIEEAGLGDVDKNQVVGDIVYLEDKHLINGHANIGDVYPPWIRITSSGIDFVDNVVDRFIENLENTHSADIEAKSLVKELSKENNISKKVKTIIEFAKTNTGLWADILNIIRLLQS